MTARVLVAGATGYVGRHVTRELKKRGRWVRALARSRAKVDELGLEVDDVHIGDVTDPATLAGACADIDVVFSCIGQMRARGKTSFDDVDRKGNERLLDLAIAAGVKRFAYVASYRGEELRRLAIVKAHEDFVETLRRAPIEHVILRPTGFFSDMEEFLEMARRGRVFLFGTGEHRINPIHGEDLAIAFADAIEGEPNRTVAVGGPEVLSYREIANLAFSALGRRPHVTRVPGWITSPVVSAVRPFSGNAAGVVEFLTAITQLDMVAPKFGTRTLGTYYTERARRA